MTIRDRGQCAHPGCGAAKGLEAHHVRHWLWGGRTDLANLVLLCPRHHLAHHDGDFKIVPLGKGRFGFLRADGQQLPGHADPGEHITTDAPLESEHATVAEDAATTRWTGEPLERQWASSILADRRERARGQIASQRRSAPVVAARA